MAIHTVLEMLEPDAQAREEVLDTAAAARCIGCSADWLAKLRLTGGGPPFHRLFKRRGIIYRRKDIDIWMDSRRFDSTSEYPEQFR